jgi:hypothetical protein
LCRIEKRIGYRGRRDTCCGTGDEIMEITIKFRKLGWRFGSWALLRRSMVASARGRIRQIRE